MDERANPIIRRHLLEILQDAVNRYRERGEDPSTYTTEELLQRVLALRGYTLRLEDIRSQLFYLRDKELVRLRETRVKRERYFTWRILAAGTDVVEGAHEVEGVAGA